MTSEFLFTSESVSEGHPDKVADQISDAVLDAVLEKDPRARVAAETLVTTGLVVLAGEITTHAVVDYPAVAREAIKRIGYDNSDFGNVIRFTRHQCDKVLPLRRQQAASEEIQRRPQQRRERG